MKYFNFVLFLPIFFAFYSAKAQQDSQFSQYMYNTININPAYTGSRGVLSVFLLNRNQWLGLDGAPRTNSFSINSPIKNSNLGFGLSFIGDKIGPVSDNSISFDASYSIPMSNNFKLSFGLKLTANVFDLDINKLNPQYQNDVNFQNFSSKLKPNFGAGVYYHSQNAYFGLSIPGFVESDINTVNDVLVYNKKLNVYFLAGHVFDLSSYLKFKPAFLTKVIDGAPVQFDVSTNFLYDDKFSFGASYRFKSAISLMTGFQLADYLYIGYAYDFETNKLSRFNSGSHEVFLRFELFNSFDRVISPRFF